MREYKILFWNVQGYAINTPGNRLVIDLYPLNVGDIYIYDQQGIKSGLIFNNPVTPAIFVTPNKPFVISGKNFQKNNWILDISAGGWTTLTANYEGRLLVAVKSYLN